MITVVNKKHHIPTKDDIYIGRPSILGNQFLVSKFGRHGCIERHKQWLMDTIKYKNKNILKALNDIKIKSEKSNVFLICWCKPAACHGDTIKEIVENL